MKNNQELTMTGALALRKNMEQEQQLAKRLESDECSRTETELELYLVFLRITNLLIKSHRYADAEAYIARAENLSKSIQTAYYSLDEAQWTGYMVNQASFCRCKSICDDIRGSIKASGDDLFYGICIMEHIFQLVEKTAEMNALYLELKAGQARICGEMAESSQEDEDCSGETLQKSLDLWEEVSRQDKRYLAEYALQLQRGAELCWKEPGEERRQYLQAALQIYLDLENKEGGHRKDILELTILCAEELLLHMPETAEELDHVFAEAEFCIASAPSNDVELSRLLSEVYFLQYCWLKDMGEAKEARNSFRKYLKNHHRWLKSGCGIFNR